MRGWALVVKCVICTSSHKRSAAVMLALQRERQNSPTPTARCESHLLCCCAPQAAIDCSHFLAARPHGQQPWLGYPQFCPEGDEYLKELETGRAMSEEEKANMQARRSKASQDTKAGVGGDTIAEMKTNKLFLRRELKGLEQARGAMCSRSKSNARCTGPWVQRKRAVAMWFHCVRSSVSSGLK